MIFVKAFTASAFVFSIFFNNSIFASSEAIIEKFLSPDGIDDKKSLYHGEMIEHYLENPTFGESLSPDIDVNTRNIYEDGSSSVYGVTLTKDGESQDYYLHLANDNGTWKLSFIRTLALTGIYYQLVEELRKKSDKTQEELWQYENALLTIKSDKELKEYLVKNITKFNELAESFKNGDSPEKVELLKNELHLNGVNPGPGYIEVNIGGLVDNFVGFLLLRNNADPPKMGGDGFIYIEKVMGRWFIYKTT